MTDLASVERAAQRGEVAQALALVDAVLAQDAGSAEAWHAKGGLHARQGEKQAAIQCYNQAMQRRPDFPEACFELGRLLEETGQVALAIQVYAHLLQLVPDHPAAGRLAALRSGSVALQKLEEIFAAGNRLLQEGRAAEAAQAYMQAQALQPDVPEVLANLGVALQRLRRYADAEQVLLRCLALRPEFPEALNTLGNVYKEANAPDKAMSAYRTALAADAGFHQGWVNLGKLLQEAGDHAGAAEAYIRALALAPGHAETIAEALHRMHYLCRWEQTERLAEALEQALLTGRQSVIPFLAALYCSPAAQRGNAERWCAAHYPQGVRFAQASALPADARRDGRLRIGYLSADYHRNATAFLISELFERHDRSQFEVLAYSAGADDGSAERLRIMNAVDVFRDLRQADDATAAQTIRQDGIDILVDLKGYTFNHRMGLMSLRPAPLAVHYLGYPGTTGAPFVDYFIADARCAPEGADAFFTEKLVRLPHSYQINDRKRPLPSGASARADYGLPEDAVVFCDFNQSYKITPAMFDLWLSLLAQVEGSVLWLFETIAEATGHLRAVAKTRGVAPERIITVPVAAPAVHMERYAHADIFLDTLPVNGHTTASDALWCGVPVVTAAGGTFASRVAASLLHAVGLRELVAADMQHYEAIALSLARDRRKREAIKAHLREKRMALPLFDTGLCARALEGSYRHMAALHRSGQPPRAFALDDACEPLQPL